MPKREFLIADITPGKLNALVKNHMQQMDIKDPAEAVRRINSGEWSVARTVDIWRASNMIVNLGTVVSDGKTGPEWIKHFERRGWYISDLAGEVLMLKEFKTTSGVKYRINVLNGDLWKDEARTSDNINADADRKINFSKLEAESACLIMDKFSLKELRKRGVPSIIIVMSHPVVVAKGSSSRSFTLGVDFCGGHTCLIAHELEPKSESISTWPSGCYGFAFSD